MAIGISDGDHLWPDGVVPFRNRRTSTIHPGSPRRAVSLVPIADGTTSTKVTGIPRMSEAEDVAFHLVATRTTSTVRAAGLAVRCTTVPPTLGCSAG